MEKKNKTEYETIVEEIIELEKKKKELLKKLFELEMKLGIPYLRFASLCKWSHFEEVHQIFLKWKSHVKFVPADSPDSSGRLEFDLTALNENGIFRDFAHLINHDALNCSMREFARSIVDWTNLGDSEESVYTRLKRYKSNYK